MSLSNPITERIISWVLHYMGLSTGRRKLFFTITGECLSGRRTGYEHVAQSIYYAKFSGLSWGFPTATVSMTFDHLPSDYLKAKARKRGFL